MQSFLDNVLLPPRRPASLPVAPPARMASPSPATTTTTTLLPMPLLMLMQEKRKYRRPEERKRIQDPKRKARLEHSAQLARVRSKRVILALAPEPKRAQRKQEVRVVEVAAAFGRDAAQLVDGCDEGAEEAGIDEGDEDGGAFCVGVADEGFEDPDAGEDGDDEEDEDVAWGEHVGFDEAVDEPGLDGGV